MQPSKSADELLTDASMALLSAAYVMVTVGSGFSQEPPTKMPPSKLAKPVHPNSPACLKSDAERFYGYWGQRYNFAVDARPHNGHHILHRWFSTVFSDEDAVEERRLCVLSGGKNKRGGGGRGRGRGGSAGRAGGRRPGGTRNATTGSWGTRPSTVKGKGRRGGAAQAAEPAESLPPAPPAFLYTANIDSLFARVGISRSQIFEMQGSCLCWQCNRPCGKEAFQLTTDFRFEIDEKTGRAPRFVKRPPSLLPPNQSTTSLPLTPTTARSTTSSVPSAFQRAGTPSTEPLFRQSQYSKRQEGEEKHAAEYPLQAHPHKDRADLRQRVLYPGHYDTVPTPTLPADLPEPFQTPVLSELSHRLQECSVGVGMDEWELHSVASEETKGEERRELEECAAAIKEEKEEKTEGAKVEEREKGQGKGQGGVPPLLRAMSSRTKLMAPSGSRSRLPAPATPTNRFTRVGSARRTSFSQRPLSAPSSRPPLSSSSSSSRLHSQPQTPHAQTQTQTQTSTSQGSRPVVRPSTAKLSASASKSRQLLGLNSPRVAVLRPKSSPSKSKPTSSFTSSPAASPASTKPARSPWVDQELMVTWGQRGTPQVSGGELSAGARRPMSATPRKAMTGGDPLASPPVRPRTAHPSRRSQSRSYGIPFSSHCTHSEDDLSDDDHLTETARLVSSLPAQTTAAYRADVLDELALPVAPRDWPVPTPVARTVLGDTPPSPYCPLPPTPDESMLFNYIRCPKCLRDARPNVRMLRDRTWVASPARGFRTWLNQVREAMAADKTCTLVILEIGCAKNTRVKTENLALLKEMRPSCTLIKIGRVAPKSAIEGAIMIRQTALRGLEAIDRRMYSTAREFGIEL